MTFRVAVLDDFQGLGSSVGGWDRLAGVDVVGFPDHVADDDELVDRLRDFDAAIVIRERTHFDRLRLERLPRLRLLVTAGEYNVGIDLEAAAAAGVTVCGTEYPRDSSTVELAWALILGLARGLCVESASVRGGGWQRGLGAGLSGRTLGLLGLGGIGSGIARVGSALGMEPVAWSQNLTPEGARSRGAELVERGELFERADFLVVCLILSARTRHLVGPDELRRMKRSAYLVNVARGPIVEEGALVEALRQGEIAGAGLDVFDVEPLPPRHPFRTLPNVLATPHLGFVTEENYSLFYSQFAEDVAAFIAGDPIRRIEPGDTYLN